MISNQSLICHICHKNLEVFRWSVLKLDVMHHLSVMYTSGTSWYVVMSLLIVFGHQASIEFQEMALTVKFKG